jgi:hypothetical protein
MMTTIFVSFAAITILYSCNTVAQTDKRKETITDFITAVKSNDTNKLYSIIDTSVYFDVQDKEHLFYQMSFLKNKFAQCNKVTDSTIKVSHRDIPFTDYTYSFCIEKKENEFEIRFTFSDFENKNKINFIEIKNKYQNTTPTSPPSTQ